MNLINSRTTFGYSMFCCCPLSLAFDLLSYQPHLLVVKVPADNEQRYAPEDPTSRFSQIINATSAGSQHHFEGLFYGNWGYTCTSRQCGIWQWLSLNPQRLGPNLDSGSVSGIRWATVEWYGVAERQSSWP